MNVNQAVLRVVKPYIDEKATAQAEAAIAAGLAEGGAIAEAIAAGGGGGGTEMTLNPDGTVSVDLP